MNVSEPIRRFGAVEGAHPALIRPDGVALTYRDLDRAIDATAHRIVAHGFRRDRPVLLPMGADDEAGGLVAAMALARLGIASAAPGLATAQPGVVACVTYPQAAEAVPPAPMWEDAETTLRVFSTSGTTGTPKHVVASHMLLRTRVLTYWLGMGVRRDVHMCGLSFGILPGFTAALRCWWAGGTLVLRNPKSAGAGLHRHGVESLLIAPASLRMFLDVLPRHLENPPSLRLIETGGSLLPAALAQEVRRRLCPTLLNLYGTNEAGAIATKWVREGSDDPRVAGHVVPGVRVDAMDDAGAPLPAGQEGLLRIRTPGLVPQYLDNPEQNAACFRWGGFVSGDIGSVGADGLVRVIGRANDVINAGGLKINPAMIEDALLGVPGVQEAAAFAVPDVRGTVEPWAAIVGAAAVPQALLQAACGPLGPMAPRRVFQIAALPRNANGKVLREVLATQAAEAVRSRIVRPS